MLVYTGKARHEQKLKLSVRGCEWVFEKIKCCEYGPGPGLTHYNTKKKPAKKTRN
jgi:hypothetical protein